MRGEKERILRYEKGKERKGKEAREGKEEMKG